MTGSGPSPHDWPDAVLAAGLLAVAGPALGGAVVRAAHGPARERWNGILAALMPPAAPMRRVPLHIDDERLIGGIDLVASLAVGRPVAERGLLAAADGGLLILPMAERADPATVARIGQALDSGSVTLARDGLCRRWPARFAVVAFDEGIGEDETVAEPLRERLGLWLDLSDTCPMELDVKPADIAAAVAAGRGCLAATRLAKGAPDTLCTTAALLGIGSLRAPILAARAATAIAALDGRDLTDERDIALAARLVLGPRATQLPQDGAARGESDPTGTAAPPRSDQTAEPDAADRPVEEHAEDIAVAAAFAALPPGLLERLRHGGGQRRQVRHGGSGATGLSAQRGRAHGTKRTAPGRPEKIDILATLRAAAPWQRLRSAGRTGGSRRIEVRKDDLRAIRRKQRRQTTTIFVVDASGSCALQRLAEAKGAVELLLADCYVRRDHVALLAFRGSDAEIVLPATRSLHRARRDLACLPGGGGTPLASAIERAAELADQELRRDRSPVIVLLTDGRANVTRDNRRDRVTATREAIDAGRALAMAGVASVLIDTALRPDPRALELAQAMGAIYLPMPHADAAGLSSAARKAAGAMRSAAPWQ